MRSKRSLYCAAAALSLGCCGALAGSTSPADARSPYYDDNYGDGYGNDPLMERTALWGKTPVLAVVALREQRVSIYDANGKIMESPVSSGQTGLETPAGIFSIVQKEEDHYSNVYDDASMPYMERITWTGISLHGGVLPGYPASHGCVRMPERFAEQLYQITKLGMRVIVVRNDIAPVEVSQPAMFTPADGQSDGDPSSSLKALAKSKFMEAQAAVMRVRDAKLAASKKAAEAAAAEKAVHAAEAALNGAQAGLKAAGRAPQAQAAQAQAKVDAAQTKLDAAKLDAQSKAEAAAKAGQEARAAAEASAIAHNESGEAQLNLSPVSVFVSRKTQRLYIRKHNYPVYEGPVMIRDADKPIGTFVFTALDYNGSSGAMPWDLVSMYKNPADAGPATPVAAKGKSKVSRAEAAPADVAGAEAALSRITVTPEERQRISAAVLPGSSLIVSDEGPSVETGKDTDFVVVMSGEPQGGLSIRHRQTVSRREYEDYGDGFFGGFARRRPSYGQGWGGRGDGWGGGRGWGWGGGGRGWGGGFFPE